jgi:hypothetical protein
MANKLPTTSFGRLVQKLKKTPMSRREITEFLLEQKGDFYRPGENHDYYNSNLYGTTTRHGILEQYGYRKGARWMVYSDAPVAGPFNTAR